MSGDNYFIIFIRKFDCVSVKDGALMQTCDKKISDNKYTYTASLFHIRFERDTINCA